MKVAAPVSCKHPLTNVRQSTCEVFLEPQETPFLSSVTENLENTTVDQPADDSRSIIRDSQIENERLGKEIHQVTT